MNNLKTLCFGFLIVSVLVESVSAIKCYSCIGCNDPFDDHQYKSSTATCSGSCVKAKTDGQVVRGCSPTDKGDKCEEEGKVTGCSCKKDLCNTASGKSISLVGLCLSIFTMFLWKK